MAQLINRSRERAAPHDEIVGAENIDKIINIDQSPIGRTPRSNPGTYTKMFDDIRGLFAELPESKIRGYRAGRFSFNVKGGRCENCEGQGLIKIEMQFLPDVYVQCEVCRGTRYNRETLQVRYKEKSVSDVLNMTVSAGAEILRESAAHPPQAGDAGSGRAGLYSHRSASHDPQRWRSAAHQIEPRAIQTRDRPDPVYFG